MPEETEPAITLRDVVQRMYESAAFYADLVTRPKHDPTCWKVHPACALNRVLDILDGTEDEEESN